MLPSNFLSMVALILILGGAILQGILAFNVEGIQNRELKISSMVSQNSFEEALDDNEKLDPDEMERIRRKVDAMSDDELASILYSVMPDHQRSKRTIGTVRRCLEKVRCLFGALRRTRVRRNSSAAAILRAISKLTSIASDATNELLGKRLGSNSGISLSSLTNLFRNTKTPSTATPTPASVDEEEEDAEAAASDDVENVAQASESVPDDKVCDQKCNLSVLVYRRLRRLLRRL